MILSRSLCLSPTCLSSLPFLCVPQLKENPQKNNWNQETSEEIVILIKLRYALHAEQKKGRGDR